MEYDEYPYYKKSNGNQSTDSDEGNSSSNENTQTIIQEPSLSEALNQFKYASQVEGKAKKTLNQYDYVFDNFTDYLTEDDPPISSITPNHVRGFLKRLMDRDLAKATVAIHHRVVQAFFNWLVDEELLEKAPTRNIDEPKTPDKYPRILDEEQTNKLIRTAENNKSTWAGFRNYTMILTFLDTGLRVNELVNARLTDLKFNERSLKVLGKGAKDRVVFFGYRTYKALRKWIDIREDKGKPLDDTVFTSQNRDKLKTRHVQRIITRLQKKANLEDTKVSPHVLRHTAATMAVRNGMGSFALKRFFGWESIKTAMKYVHMGDQTVKEAFKKSSPIDGLEEEE
ncbi:MAG: tyrosine-type recombinase/integrase [Candidatus Bipolaricaulota bacterium]|nr:tyrosine-type recombinase/integrase [Candidatus Bipolaricaulota bacterium]